MSLKYTQRALAARLNFASSCDKGFDCSGTDSHSELGARLSYTNGTQPVPKGFDCPTGTQFKVPFPYGYGQQVWDLTPATAHKGADDWVISDFVRAPTLKGEYVLRCKLKTYFWRGERRTILVDSIFLSQGDGMWSKTRKSVSA